MESTTTTTTTTTTNAKSTEDVHSDLELMDDASEVYERPESSESGIITEMEQHRSQTMNNNNNNNNNNNTTELETVLVSSSSHDDSGVMPAAHSKKKKSLSTRVAKGIKKQLKTGKTSSSSTSKVPRDRPRSLSPPRSRDINDPNSNNIFRPSNSPTSSGDDEVGGVYQAYSADGSSSPPLRRASTSTSVIDGVGEPKKKYKYKYKHVAKAAAAAAKKLKGKKSSKSSKSNTTTTNVDASLSSSFSMDNSTSSQQQPFNNQDAVNNPVSAAMILDSGMIPQHLLSDLPNTLTECDEEEDSSHYDDTTTEASMEMISLMEETTHITTTMPVPLPLPPQPTTTPATTAPAPPPATTTITMSQKAPALNEDEALRLAEAMALAVQANPTKSHQDIQRMVLSLPEFQHLAPPEGLAPPSSSNTGSSGSSSSSKKTWKQLQSKIASGAKTAQKGFLEYAGSLESALLGRETSASSTSSSIAAPAPSSSLRDSTVVARSALASVASVISSSSSAAAATTAVPATIPEEPSMRIAFAEQSQSTGVSMQSSDASFPCSEDEPSENVYMTASRNSFAKSEAPIIMTDVIWKRRSGFGVYYRSSAWERRRFILQGNALSYFRAKGENLDDNYTNNNNKASGGDSGGGDYMDDRTERFENDPQFTSMTNASSKSTSTKQRMMDALEQTATSLGLSASVAPSQEKPSGDGSSSARGYMDLVKENATVCATLGHSGAPSPFCLSIKVNGETKWKLCFASHQAQLRWLAAITDVIVQNSVDNYNLKLLSAADPSNIDPTAVFASSVYEPPSNAEGQLPSNLIPSTVSQSQNAEDSDLPTPNYKHLSGRRLWMMEPYIIRAKSELQNDEKQDAVDRGDDDYEDDDEDEDDDNPEPSHQPTQELDATVNDSDVWFVPEKRLMFVAVMVNAALLYARNSTLAVQTFWTMVIVANMTLFACLESMPRPGVATAATSNVRPKAAPSARSWKKRDRKKGTGSGGADSNKGAGAIGGKPTKKKEKYMPMAGMSAVRLKCHTDPKVNAKGEPFAAWMQIPGESLAVRSHGYLKTNLKVPSPGSLYELMQMDLFESPFRYPDMAPRVKLPKLAYEIDPNEKKTWRAPDHFVVSLSLPTDPPKLGASTTDGGGYTVTMYFTMNMATREILKRITAEGYNPADEPPPADMQKSQVNAVRLFEEWCRRAPNDLEFQKRFKMVPNCPNAKEVGLPSWIGKYNGKPFLIKRPGQTGFFLPHPELSCIEYDISLHVFPYLAKQGICYMRDTLFKKILASVGFVIEGRSDDELPECVIGLGQVCYPDPEVSIQAADFFAGTAPRSFEPEDVTARTALPVSSSVTAPVKAPGEDAITQPMEITV